MALTRRTLLIAGVGTLTAGLAGGAGWLALGPTQPEQGVADVLAALNRLNAANRVTSTGAWSPSKIVHHLAQSVEMSMTGFPVHKSAAFQNTLGSAAFAVFRRRGQMRHGLDEPIPGAPPLEQSGDIDVALERLRRAINRFAEHDGDYAPHFAYGRLSREQYGVAHALHLNNHLSELRLS